MRKVKLSTDLWTRKKCPQGTEPPAADPTLDSCPEGVKRSKRFLGNVALEARPSGDREPSAEALSSRTSDMKKLRTVRMPY